MATLEPATDTIRPADTVRTTDAKWTADAEWAADTDHPMATSDDAAATHNTAAMHYPAATRHSAATHHPAADTSLRQLLPSLCIAGGSIKISLETLVGMCRPQGREYHREPHSEAYSK